MSRRSECRRVEDLLACVRAGESRALILIGPPGIGKSWLCRQAVARADGFTVVRTRGLEREAHFGYSGLFDVLTPLLDGRLGRLAPARADALRGALRIAATAAVDPFAVAVASLDLLALAAEDAPLLVVVDDAPWVDAESLEALRFAALRLHADRVGFLFAARSESAASFTAGGMDALAVGGLDTAEAVALIDEFAPAAVLASVADTLAEAGRGDPLWLREAARELTAEQMCGAAPLTERFSAPADVQASFLRLALHLSAPARRALVVLAADEQAPGPVLEQALAVLGSGSDALSPGLDCGLLGLEDGRLRFSHPLALAAAREVAEPAEQRLAHQALSRAWSEADEPERAAWHRAAGGDGPDAQLSSALAGVARTTRARGASMAAAEAWRWAIETAPDAALPLRLERARDLTQAGQAAHALTELDRILDRECPAELRADAEILQGQLLISQGRLDQAAVALLAGAARIRDDDPGRAAVLLCGAAFVQTAQAQLPAAVTTAELAVALADPLDGSAAAAESTLGSILVAAGRGDRGYPLLLLHAGRSHTREGMLASARLGLFACWMEDYDTARRELEYAVGVARDRGLVSSMPLALSALGELEYRLGNWIAARTHAGEALRLAEDSDQFLHCGHSVLLLLDAIAGDADGALGYADLVLTTAGRSGSQSMAMSAHAGLGLLQLGLDDPEAAIVHLTRTREIAEHAGFAEPNYVQWMGDLVESQIRAGLEDEARGTLAEFEGQATRTDRPWALGTAARCRGLLSAADAADAAFTRAQHMTSPFERARTQLCWGERLRRDGRRIDARMHLHEAHGLFSQLGATPWAEKAARELRSSGGRTRRGLRARGHELTAQETQIAALVAEGKTNKTIATALFLSPKTIEFHLGHVYRKLGVSNRTQLARALLTD